MMLPQDTDALLDEDALCNTAPLPPRLRQTLRTFAPMTPPKGSHAMHPQSDDDLLVQPPITTPTRNTRNNGTTHRRGFPLLAAPLFVVDTNAHEDC